MLATKEEMRALGLALKGISYHVCEAIHWNELIDLIGSSIRSLPSKNADEVNGWQATPPWILEVEIGRAKGKSSSPTQIAELPSTSRIEAETRRLGSQASTTKWGVEDDPEVQQMVASARAFHAEMRMEEAFQERLLRRKPGASIDMAEMETLLGLAGLSFDGA